MSADHLAGALALSREAGWPHRAEDWQLTFAVSEGIVALEGEGVIATALLTPYGDNAATINMVIVRADKRGTGLGRRMMEAALAKAGSRTCRLVATTDGLPLYAKLGFVADGQIVQHQGIAAPVTSPPNVEWIAAERELARIAALDGAAYGSDRTGLMGRLGTHARFVAIREAERIEAFAAIRPFGLGLSIGPVVARSEAEAMSLIDFLLADSRGRFVRIDTRALDGLSEWLAGRRIMAVSGGVAMQRSGRPDVRGTQGVYRSYALVSQALG